MRISKKIIMSTSLAVIGIALGLGGVTSTNGATKVSVPEKNNNIAEVGAVMPYVRYESTAAILGGGAVLCKSGDFDRMNIASQASEQSYISLPKSGASASWAVKTTGAGITMRFSLPDSADGMGLKGSLDVYVNDKKVKTVDLTSYYMWQYFASGHPSDKNNGGAPCFAFDEVHFKLNTALKSGDVIRIQSTGQNNLVYGIDFLEIEQIPAVKSKPANAYSITDYGADGTDDYDDYGAIQKCITAAKAAGKDVYIPAGTFKIGQIWRINTSDIKISGAGIWHTNIQFTNANASSGGISGADASNVEFCDMYINSNLRSRYNENAGYKCFMDNWSNGSYIHDIWEEHFECGFWFADYTSPLSYSDNVLVYNCRIRNNLADGVNFCQGTSNATVYNCDVRNNGDDGLAMWNNNYLNAKDERNNRFCYNTIEFIWRAGGIAIYGGSGHKIYNNYIADTFMASGIHLNTNFGGYKFGNNNGITFSNNVLIRCGTTADSWNSNMGAIDIYGDTKNITFENTYMYDSQHDAIRICNTPTNLVFCNTTIIGTGKDGASTDTDDNGAAIKYEYKNSTKSITYSHLSYANIAYSNIIFGSRILSTFDNEKNLGNNYRYTIPTGNTKVVKTPSEITVKRDENKDTKITVAKTKIKKATKKKKSKSIKVSLKKVSKVTGYEIRVSAKKNMKKVIVKKTTKKTKFTISSKKIKNKKTLYISARAYKKVNSSKHNSSWTKSKKVKITK